MKKYMLLVLFLCACDVTQPEMPKRIPSYPQYLKTADAFVGFNERANRSELKQFMKVDPVYYEWCAAFVNAVLNVNSISGSESVTDNPLLARGFLTWGDQVDKPRLGDIVVFSRGNQGWQGHVGFYINTEVVDGVTYFVILGGNQDDKVSYELYPASKALGIRRWNTATSSF